MSPVLADAVFWAAVACCVVAQAALFRSQLAAPVTADGAPAAPARRAAEVVWAVVPALALALVLAWTWRTLHPRPTAATAPAVAALASATIQTEAR